MQGSIQITITGIDDEDYAVVAAYLLIKTVNNECRHHQLYYQRHLAQDLTDSMSAEQWAFATIAHHTDMIKAALSEQILQGSRTLISDVPIHQRALRLGTWPEPPGRPESTP
jgi:hypothetical protein